MAKAPVSRGLLSQEQFAVAFDLALQGAVQRQGQHPGHHQPTGADYGSPARRDTIGITLWNGSGGIWFSTNWVGSPPAIVEQLLGGGNLDVH